MKLSADDLVTIYESLEITVQSLDRPAPGAEENLLALMDRVRAEMAGQ